MNEMEQEKIQQLFQDYVNVLNADFYINDRSVENAQHKCREIAKQLLGLGFVVLSRNVSELQTREPSDDTIQSIVIINYEILLVSKTPPVGEISMDFPFADASAQSKILGPIVPRPDSQQKIAAEHEAWLRTTLGSLKQN